MITPVEHKFKIKECVSMTHDPEKLKRMITSFRVYDKGDIIYDLACGAGSTTAFEYELELVKEFEDSF